tara:strand:+ start:897 stop:1130 length:234 start_codon:yes stop_codon:yes gene_type:complete
MLIPIKCVTCGKVLADKYRYYEKRVREKKTSAGNDYNNVTYFTSTTKDKTAEGLILDELGFDKLCCRRHILTHVNIE